MKMRMRQDKIKCVLCQHHTVSARFAICVDCALQYEIADQQATGVRFRPIAEWPAWVRKLYQDYNRERKSEQVWLGRNQVLYEEGGEQDDDPTVLLKPYTPQSSVDILLSEGWMQRNPYSTYELNTIYQRMHGIPVD